LPAYSQTLTNVSVLFCDSPQLGVSSIQKWARIIIPQEIREIRDRSAHGSDKWRETNALCIKNQQGDEDKKKVWREVEQRAREHQAEE
jgi:hypothetical protein